MGLERVVKAPWRLRQLRSGPLGTRLGDFCDWLLEQGFSWNSIRTHIAYVGHLNTWLSEENRECTDGLSRRDVERFLEAYPYRCRHRGPLENHLQRVRCSIHRFVEFLNQRGLFDPLPPSPVYQSLLDSYLAWMREHQHAAEITLGKRRDDVKRRSSSIMPVRRATGLVVPCKRDCVRSYVSAFTKAMCPTALTMPSPRFAPTSWRGCRTA